MKKKISVRSGSRTLRLNQEKFLFISDCSLRFLKCFRLQEASFCNKSLKQANKKPKDSLGYREFLKGIFAGSKIFSEMQEPLFLVIGEC